VDAVITDPPYGINGGSGRINLDRGKGNYSNAFPDTSEYIIASIVPAIKTLMELCGCVVLTPGCKNMMCYPQPDSFGCFFQPAAVGLQTFGNMDAQPIFYYGKNATGKNMGKSCSFQMTEQPEKTGHPCTKPLKTWVRLLIQVTNKGMTVLDPFMGSGTTGIACIRTGRKFIGIEISEEYLEIAKNRIKIELQQQLLNL
jgi:DNA modification methylase